MLCLSFNIDEDVFGISVNNIVEIIPLVRIKTIPYSPDCLAGLINYRGDIIPLFDITSIIKNRASKHLFSTRIIVVKNLNTTTKLKYIAILAEQVTETIEYTKDKLKDPQLTIEKAVYLDKLLMIENKSIQLIDIDKLIDSEIMSFIKKEFDNIEKD